MGTNAINPSSSSSPFFRVMLWGPFRVEKRVGETYEAVKTADWGGSNYPRLLLKALVCCPGRRGRREALLDMLWPEMDSEQATANLNTATTKLRTLLRPMKGQESLLITEDDSTIYQLPDQRVLWVDSEEFQQTLERAERLGRASAEALPLLEEAITLAGRGTFLEGEDGKWVAEKRATRDLERYRGRIWLAESYVQQGRPGQAETVLTTMLDDDPFDEDVLCRLMNVLCGQGMTHQALLLYQRIYDFFVQEQMELSEATKTLAIQLREHRPLSLQEDVLAENGEEGHDEALTLVQALRLQHQPLMFLSPHTGREPFLDSFFEHSSLDSFEQEASRTSFWEFQRDLVQGIVSPEKVREPHFTYQLSRRQVLLAISTLTLPLLISFQKRPSFSSIDTFLSSCSASLTACWQFSREFDIGPVYSLVSHYLPFLVTIMQDSPVHQKKAAYLAAQAALLQAIVGRHMMNLQVAERSCKQAVIYSQKALDPLLHVITLRHLAMIYFYAKRTAEEFALYEQMKPFLFREDIPPIVKSFIYAGWAGIQALNQQAKALTSIDLAREQFLLQPANEPGPLYIDYDYSQVFLSEGLAHYDLGRYKEALDTFLQIERFSSQMSLAERGRLEFLNFQARTVLHLPSRDRDMQQCLDYWTEAVQGSTRLKSKQRYDEAAHIYELMTYVWPQEKKIKELRELLTF